MTSGNRREPRETSSAPCVLRVVLSHEVDAPTLQRLHREGLTATGQPELQALIRAVGGERLSPVYPLSPEEIADDSYGFARDFQLFLRADASTEAAIEIIQQSSLIKEVKSIVFRQAFQ